MEKSGITRVLGGVEHDYAVRVEDAESRGKAGRDRQHLQIHTHRCVEGEREPVLRENRIRWAIIANCSV